MKRFASRRVDPAQARSIGFMSAIGRSALGCKARHQLGQYRIDHLSC
jgi:hypothetical protein